MTEEIETMTQKWREWCKANAPDGAVSLDRVPNLLLALVVDEREECAKVADRYGAAQRRLGANQEAEVSGDIAIAIRGRGRWPGG